MTTIRIRGGRPISGEVTPVVNKNSILPALAASVLTAETVTYHCVPQTSDVAVMFEVLEHADSLTRRYPDIVKVYRSLGAEISWA